MSSTRGIDFATLTLKDALDLAVLVEEEACERYGEFADQMEMHDTPDAARFFRYMIENEEKHRIALAERRCELFGTQPSAVTRAMVFDVEAPDYDEARAFMTLREALNAALRSEEKAHAFFAAAIPRIKDASVKALFEELCAEEVEHQNLVRKEIEKAPPDPKIAAKEFADEPVGE
jgi:erythrin-vacuolar iron transport family protein